MRALIYSSPPSGLNALFVCRTASPHSHGPLPLPFTCFVSQMPSTVQPSTGEATPIDLGVLTAGEGEAWPSGPVAPLRQPRLGCTSSTEAGEAPVPHFISLMPMFGPSTSYAASRGIHILVSSRLQPVTSSMMENVASYADALGLFGGEGPISPLNRFCFAYRVFVWAERASVPPYSSPAAQLERRHWFISHADDPGKPPEEVW